MDILEMNIKYPAQLLQKQLTIITRRPNIQEAGHKSTFASHGCFSCAKEVELHSRSCHVTAM